MAEWSNALDLNPCFQSSNLFGGSGSNPDVGVCNFLKLPQELVSSLSFFALGWLLGYDCVRWF
jgi:hypothetical protein